MQAVPVTGAAIKTVGSRCVQSVVLVGAVALFALATCVPAVPSAASTERRSPWSEVDAPPFGGRVAPTVVAGPERFLVFGGFSDDGRRLAPTRSAAIFTPRTKKWASIGTAPIRRVGYPSGAWDGQRFVVAGAPCRERSRQQPGSDLTRCAGGRVAVASYDPTTRSWAKVAVPDQPEFLASADTGTVRAYPVGGTVVFRLGRYSPASNSVEHSWVQLARSKWRVLATPPGEDLDSCSTGSMVISLASTFGTGAGNNVPDIAVLDLQFSSPVWTTSTEPQAAKESGAASHQNVACAGGVAVLTSPLGLSGDAVNLRNEAWTRLPRQGATSAPKPHVSTGGEIWYWPAEAATNPRFQLNTRAFTWTRGPTTPSITEAAASGRNVLGHSHPVPSRHDQWFLAAGA